jgi:hypothetical protein
VHKVQVNVEQRLPAGLVIDNVLVPDFLKNGAGLRRHSVYPILICHSSRYVRFGKRGRLLSEPDGQYSLPAASDTIFSDIFEIREEVGDFLNNDVRSVVNLAALAMLFQLPFICDVLWSSRI